ncbi:DinB family protein [Candidatus Sumerlaeota bacterium]|nr:DinB family protein [Candidatus Sumerlaeota bacterium]
MTIWNDAAHWALGRGFWYADPVVEVCDLSEAQLFWVPTPLSLSVIWHVGHIAHRERYLVGHVLQGISEDDLKIPEGYEVFGAEWRHAETVRDHVKSVQAVFNWCREVRAATHEYVDGLKPEDYGVVPPSSNEGLNAAQVLYQIVAHTALHIGRIQLVCSILRYENERAC